MGLDVYAGSLSRYYSGNWETIMQKIGREQGLAVEIVRETPTPTDAITDESEIQSIVLDWRKQLAVGLNPHIAAELSWDERPDAPYFTDKPAWDCYTSLLLWAAYAEQDQLTRPVEYVDNFSTDPAFQKSCDPNFKSAYEQLIGDVEIWLPVEFDFVFRAPLPPGNEVTFGSVPILKRQLDLLNLKNWRASESEFDTWRRDGAEHQAPMESGAKFAFAIMHMLAAKAEHYSLVLKLDY